MYNIEDKNRFIELANKLRVLEKGFIYLFTGLIILLIPLIGVFGFIPILGGLTYLIWGYMKAGDTTLSHSKNYKRIAYLLLISLSMMIFNMVLFLYLNIYGFRVEAYNAIVPFINTPSNAVSSMHIILGYTIYLLYSNMYVVNVFSQAFSPIKLFFFSTFILSILTYFAISYSMKMLSDDLDVPSLNISFYFLALGGLFITGAYISFNLYIFYKNITVQYIPYVYPFIGIMLVPMTLCFLAYIFNAVGISYAGYGINEYAFINNIRFAEQEKLVASGYAGSVAMAKNLEEIQNELNKKEKELADKELYLNAKLEELNSKDGPFLADGNASRNPANIKKVEKVKTGIPRLDDLLYGGYPVGSNILVSGPAHSGKEMFVKMFIASQIKNGTPAIIVLTDKSIASFEEEMEYIIPSFHQYAESGMIKYIDLYNAIMGGKKAKNDSTVIHLTEKNNFESIYDAVESFATKLKKNGYKQYCFGFESLSTIIAYTSANQTFGFLQPFVGKRKVDNAVSLYIVDAGIHSESDMEILNHAMDGEISIKGDNINTYFSIKGITEVQTRSPVNFTFTKDSIKIGSFYLDHIR
ncbi:MAG: RAD55 family ATPase [Thermoplasmata archaeon]